MTEIERKSSKECAIIREKLEDYFKNDSRIKDIQLDRVNINSKEGRYLLLNLSINSKNFHAESKAGFEETDEEIFNQIVKSIKKFVIRLDKGIEESLVCKKRKSKKD